MRHYFLAITLLLCSQASHSQTSSYKQSNDSIVYVNAPPMIMQSKGYAPYLYQYEPKKIKLLAELPDSTASKIISYLKKRVGTRYYQTLKFIGGQKVELTGKDSARLEAKDYKWKLATYYIRFEYPATRRTKQSFEAGASFDAYGIVVDSVNLPSQARNFDKFKLISVERAIQIARNNWPGLRNRNWISKETISLDYSPLYNSFVWWFSKVNAEGPGQSHLKRIFINANTGEVLRIRDNTHRYAPF